MTFRSCFLGCPGEVEDYDGPLLRTAPFLVNFQRALLAVQIR